MQLLYVDKKQDKANQSQIKEEQIQNPLKLPKIFKIILIIIIPFTIAYFMTYINEVII